MAPVILPAGFSGGGQVEGEGAGGCMHAEAESK